MLMAMQRRPGIPAQRRQPKQRQGRIAQNRVAGEQRDDLISARHAEMGALAARHLGDVAVKQLDRAAIGKKLAGDEIEQRGLAGAVRADDQPALAWLDFQADVGGDAQAAARFAQALDGKRGHGFGSTTGAAGCVTGAAFGFAPLIARHAERDSRAMPGTRPSGMNTTMATKMAPSMKFQRTT